MHKATRAALAALIGISSLTATAPAFAADPLYGNYEDGAAVCARPAVLNKIRKNFRYQVTHVPNLPDVEIGEFHRIHQHRYIAAGEDRPIARRYCGATAEFTDGRQREVWYLIEEGQGFSTLLEGFGLATETRGANVEFCVSGFDRWMVYDGACRVLR